MKNNITHSVVWYATVAALLLIARVLDHVVTGWLPINAAIVTLTVAYACIFIRPTLKNGLICGFIFGLMSLLTTIMFGSVTTSWGGFLTSFLNPCISVLPRVAVGAAAAGVFILVRGKSRSHARYFAAVATACVAATIVNTSTVMGMITVFRNINGAGANYFLVVYGVLGTNFLLEVLIPAVITPPVAWGVRRALKYDIEETAPVYTDETATEEDDVETANDAEIENEAELANEAEIEDDVEPGESEEAESVGQRRDDEDNADGEDE